MIEIIISVIIFIIGMLLCIFPKILFIFLTYFFINEEKPSNNFLNITRMIGIAIVIIGGLASITLISNH